MVCNHRSFRESPLSELLVTLDVPNDWKRFKLPSALDEPLQQLLDHQDRDGRLSRAERREAAALVELVDMLALMKLRVRFV